jgi:hypothetical protein
MTIDSGLSTDAGCELYTYYNYVKAWVIYSERTYGSGDGGIDTLVNKMESKDAVKRLRTDMKSSYVLRPDYLRGKYTLLLMQQLPIDKHPELALSANMWLPVQSYYAINGVGLALLLALKQRGKEDNHRAFRASFANLLHSYFPPPFCACCKGGPDRSYFSFNHINTTAAQVKQQSNLENPANADGDHFLGKSLATTRTETLKKEYENRRNDKKSLRCQHPKLSQDEKKGIWIRWHDTTICDLLYRMRVQSNYKNPDMYLFAAGNIQDAASHYRNLLYLTRLLIAGLDLLISKKIGKPELTKLNRVIALAK